MIKNSDKGSKKLNEEAETNPVGEFGVWLRSRLVTKEENFTEKGNRNSVYFSMEIEHCLKENQGTEYYQKSLIFIATLAMIAASLTDYSIGFFTTVPEFKCK